MVEAADSPSLAAEKKRRVWRSPLRCDDGAGVEDAAMIDAASAIPCGHGGSENKDYKIKLMEEHMNMMEASIKAMKNQMEQMRRELEAIKIQKESNHKEEGGGGWDGKGGGWRRRVAEDTKKDN